jgi:hypothetical protein
MLRPNLRTDMCVLYSQYFIYVLDKRKIPSSCLYFPVNPYLNAIASASQCSFNQLDLRRIPISSKFPSTITPGQSKSNSSKKKTVACSDPATFKLYKGRILSPRIYSIPYRSQPSLTPIPNCHSFYCKNIKGPRRIRQ